ncbi:BZ3500_MvSof-1268-A1-R1_Chr2-3g05260 [Microbotryum saponariae]|uniref:BZ3500_MvSof-1268-A1-R1_Chr2-3g05260 protein n=1 Tax=Microbotryum saponariae TaxID=289078 RepID=A0A2X0N7C9_9BASI|nr:BZ3500_MvSof-1268-A1-R1_Chr2-3g05260 [Microbotryum saponariae]SDA01086.1 BZ3501_MvSof-1269-A2-R1_Chr2-2g04933 [Microbotryum saponariae]
MDTSRGATINGRPVRDPAEAARWIEGVIKGQMEKALSTEDKQLLMQANAKLMGHATLGMYIGVLVGPAYIFRQRFTAGWRAATKASAGGGAGASAVTTTTPPRLFYPTKASDPTGRGAANGPQAAKSKMTYIGRGVGLGLLGGFIGSQIGVVTGTRAAQNLIKDSGQEARIAAKLKKAMDQAVLEIKQGSTGLETASNPLLKRSNPFGSVGSEGSSAIDGPPGGMVEDVAHDDAAADDRDAFLSREFIKISQATIYAHLCFPSSCLAEDGSVAPSRRAPMSRSADPNGAPSRWEELRKSRAAPLSSWDTIRESSSRRDVPSAAPADVSSGDGQNQGQLPSIGSSAADREARRRKFEELMEQERRGVDNVGLDQSFDERKWK